MMNLGDKIFTLEEEHVQMNGSWVPLTPEKPFQIRSDTISAGWQENRVAGGNLKKLTVPGSGYMKEMLQCNGLDQNVHLVGQTEEYNHFYGGSSERSASVINHIDVDFDSNRLNTLELLYMKNASDNGYADRNLSESINMAVRTPVLPKFRPHGGDFNADGFTVNENRNYTDSDTVYADANLLAPNRNSECDSSNLYDFLNNDIHGSFSSLLNSSLSETEIPHGSFHIPCGPNNGQNSADVTEADYLFSFTNSFQSVPGTMNQFNKFTDNHFMKYATAETQIQVTGRLDSLVASTGNDYHEFHDGLLQHIVDTSAAISKSHNKNEGSENDQRSENGLDIDLNKTPEQKPPKRRKHRPKVIKEGKPKRTPNPETRKKRGSKENPPQKRKYVRKNVPKEGATPQADVIEALGSVTTTRKACRKALNFDLEENICKDQNKTVSQQEIQGKNGLLTGLLSAPSICYDTNSTLVLNKQDEFTVENQQPRGMDDGVFLLQQKLSDRYLPKELAKVPLTANAEMQIKNLSEAEKGPAQGNAGLCNERNKGCLEQCIHTDGTDNVLLQSVTCLEFPQRTKVPMSQNILHLVPNILPNCIEGSHLKRKYCHASEKQYVFASNPLDSSFLLHKEIFQLDENCNGTPLDENALKTQKRRKTQNELGSQKVRKGKNKSQTHLTDETSSCYAGDGLTGSDALHNFHPLEGSSLKRKYCHANEKQYVSASNPLDSSLLYKEIFQVDENCNGIPLDEKSLKTQKRRKTQNEIGSQKVRRKGKYKSQTHLTDETSSCYDCDGLTGSDTLHNFHSLEGSSLKRKYCHANEKQYVSTLNPLDSSLLHKEILQVDENCNGTPLDENLLKTQKRRKTQNELGSQKVRRKGNSKSQAHLTDETSSCYAGDGFTGSDAFHKICSTPIDEIICRLKDLNLGGSNISRIDGQSAIVLYKGENSVVPYVGFDLTKKRKPRPKVDLDPETERTWKLLMDKEGSEGLERNDEEKEKWWEEEREVFRGRVDSFIARMHLVQGDRRFSRWKGSVVDSVIGVFLTQNVSDHLSSSAFLSLAARFPLKSEVCKVNQDDIMISSDKRLNHPTYHQGIMPPHDTSEHWRDCETSNIKISLEGLDNQSSKDKITLSQDSLDHSITGVARGIRSCSGSNSEAEGPTTGCKPWKTPLLNSTNSVQAGRITLFQEFYCSVNGVSLFDARAKDGQVLHDFEALGMLKTSQMNGKESSGPETISLFNKLQDTDYRRVSIQDLGGSADKLTEKQHGQMKTQELATNNPYEPLSVHVVQLQDNSPSGSDTNHHQPLSGHHLVGENFLKPNGMPFIESGSTPQKLSTGKYDSVKNPPNICNYTEGFHAEKRISEVNGQAKLVDRIAEPKPQEQLCTSGTTNIESKQKVSKSRKIKHETEKVNKVNWDDLRKQAQVNGTKKERSKEAMDSLDYEAMRHASVKEISETIKERGMNNMLAERMKEFLDRLVKEHGGIDLEWLRDVPPDKAKDYLLSMRGLGLKSVECVRLLTLHHLAFPVDTNVGRIAVRLGWVPLQPLPESLQLHLLELYPVLESIQKYLWPRLCKLDQKTLYELHYQMITFGKVFCTKSKPNCNACPMRAECRHFASAFASARLALPGPEEKGMVSNPVPIATERNPTLNMNPVVLPLPDNNLPREATSEIRECEPIIEEPTTPEQECPDTQALESDIEDFFCEDPDEIPTIKLNAEEFAMNVQNILQGNMELVEGDLSKALVALNPAKASIPTPKLKNVSRLRTEHHVYELPDSHPLLENMDKRETDDPSPYLLAIWTPGETANSIEQPEKSCKSQDSNNLCNDQTCFSCNSVREANSQIVRGTLLIPCRTATRGSFPLNGTYFQVNETMHPAFNQSMSLGNGYGICQGGLSTLEHLYHPFSEVSQLTEFNSAFGEGLFASEGLTKKRALLALSGPDCIFQLVD